ncbi:hypothetical protein BpHYR1_047055 [Brachionus plicatilis]|uniref:Uncharacterized protein n=1 Tax=Brachionus plicatilis TaxID=10195 RepID=A0A3M7RXW9_BRAPC|nr:hypothetical protein BpHYR1_047055 [Brachionus plicatilis]
MNWMDKLSNVEITFQINIARIFIFKIKLLNLILFSIVINWVLPARSFRNSIFSDLVHLMKKYQNR